MQFLINANGKAVEPVILSDTSGNPITAFPATVTGVHFGSLGTVAHAAVVAGAANLKYLRATNKNTTKRFLQVFDQVADLSGGETPLRTWEIPPGSATASAERIVELADLGGGPGMAFATGLVWGISTSEAIYAVGTASDHIVDGYYN